MTDRWATFRDLCGAIQCAYPGDTLAVSMHSMGGTALATIGVPKSKKAVLVEVEATRLEDDTIRIRQGDSHLVAGEKEAKPYRESGWREEVVMTLPEARSIAEILARVAEIVARYSTADPPPARRRGASTPEAM